MSDKKPGRFLGEATAFLALFLDNAGVLIFLNAILVFTFNFPADIVLTRMIPGTAIGVFMGDLIYTWMAVRLMRKTGRADVTAMPLGLDTPSTIGIAYAVLGPTFIATRDPILTWHVGMATLFMIGVVKIFTSFIGGWIQRNIPTAGLLGSIGGVGLMLLGFLPMIEIFNEAIVGLAALGLIFAALYSRLQFPGRIHGVVAALLVGTGIHFALGWGGYLPEVQPPSWGLHLCLPVFSLDFFRILPQSLQYLPLAIPFGILTIIGGINNTESARLAGDSYRPRDILLTEAVTKKPHCVLLVDASYMSAEQQLLWKNIQRAVQAEFHALQWPFAWPNMQDGRGAASYVQGFLDAVSAEKNVLCLGEIPHLQSSEYIQLASLQDTLDQPLLKKRLWQFMQNKIRD